MLKVFLVEDEIEVREGIKNSINWREEGFVFCGDASDGELAYPQIQREKPDIVITDIRMPFMNGLELSRLVKRELPKCKIILFSGYEEFKYAREAIQIGVTEYLLKPIKSTELIQAVKKVEQQILLERIEKANHEFYTHEMEENEAHLKRRFFNEMVEGTISIAEMINRGKELGLTLGAKFYQVVLLQFHRKQGEESFSKEMLTVGRELGGIFSGLADMLLFDRGIDGIALLFMGDTRDQIDQVREKQIAIVKDFFLRYPTVHYFGGIGEVVDRLTNLSASFEKAARAFSYRFISDSSTILDWEEFSPQSSGNHGEQRFSTVELGQLDFRKVESFLKSGGQSELLFFVEEFLKSIEGMQQKSLLFKQYILANTYMAVVQFLEELGVHKPMEEPFPGNERINEGGRDGDRLKSYMMRIFGEALELRDEQRTKSYRRMIDEAKRYIHEHYTDENISLIDTAAHVNLSPSHFSVVFGRETGKSFIRYLTDLRMNKAKELLRCTDLRCSDISIAIGYKDPHYFSYLFKKLHSCTPVQYRASAG